MVLETFEDTNIQMRADVLLRDCGCGYLDQVQVGSQCIVPCTPRYTKQKMDLTPLQPGTGMSQFGTFSIESSRGNQIMDESSSMAGVISDELYHV